MPFSFNLTDQPWVPCLYEGESLPQDRSLRQVLADAPDVREIVDPSPLVTAALHRLLLAILHRNFGPSNRDEWYGLWNAGAWDTSQLERYFQQWHDRFDLFHHRWPFYQVAGLPEDAAHTIAKLAHELGAGNNPALFDHSDDDAPTAWCPARAARYLVALQAFATPGLLSFEKGQPQHRSADAAPLEKASVLLARGPNLFHTLMLNLMRLNGTIEEPFGFDPNLDIPAWERRTLTEPMVREADGYIDLLTWQSRRALLIPEGQSSYPQIRHAVIMKGFQFPKGFSLVGRETMTAFKKRTRPQAGQDPWPAITFQIERALWRDSLPLLERTEDRHYRPRTLEWLADLEAAGAFAPGTTVELDAYGLCTDRAKVFLWRHERLPLPLAFLKEKSLTDRLGFALGTAEDVAQGLRNVVRDAVKELLPPGSDRPRGRPGTDQASQTYKSLAPERRYWSCLDVPFRTLVVRLAETFEQDQGKVAMQEWAARVRDAASDAFNAAADSLEASPRGLKAVAIVDPRFRGMLNRLISPYFEETEEPK